MKISSEDGYYTYLLRCKDNTYYCGWTRNVLKRLEKHNQGNGAKYTRYRRPCILVYYETFSTRQEAMRREWAIKQLSRRQKEALIGSLETEDDTRKA